MEGFNSNYNNSWESWEAVAIRPVPTCCFSQDGGIRIIGFISCASGSFITILTLLSCWQEINKLFPFHVLHTNLVVSLLFIGLSSAATSSWLLFNQEKLALMVWTAFHGINIFATFSVYWSLLAETDFSFLLQILFSFIGINFCVTIFNCLVMIEFLLHPVPIIPFKDGEAQL